jgi:signal transduction histidine kinase
MPDRPLIAVVTAVGGGGLILAAEILGLDLPEVLVLGVAGVAYACGRYAQLRAGAAGAVVLFGALAAGGDSVVPVAFCTAAPWLVGRVLRSREDLVDALDARTRELAAEQEALARVSVGHERARIARELHDIVAHHLAVIVVQAGAGRMASDEDDADRLGAIRRAGEEALEEMSRLVDLVQPGAGAGAGDARRLEALLEHAEAAGLRLRAEGLSDLRLAPQLQPLAYRVVQEGLTNAMKHAPASEVRLRVAVVGGALEIELRDAPGDAPGSLAGTGAGLGLAGLRERVESLGGSLDAGPAGEHGWRLHARVPLEQAAAPSPSSG